jgi:hypothetical protein
MNRVRIASDLLGPDVLIPLVVPTVTFCTLTVMVAIVLYFRYRSQRLRQELYTSFLERGAPIPAELLASKPRTGSVDLRRGMVLLLGGIGLSLSLLLAHLPEGSGFGLIPALIGVGYLVVWKMESRANGGESAP